MKERVLVLGQPLARPALARTEIVDKAARSRLEADLDGALKRRPSNERRLAGVLRALAPLSPSLRAKMAEATDVFLRRSTLDRDLYAACMRSVGEAEDKSASPLLRRALALDSAGGSAALSAACFSSDAALGPLLAKVAAGHKAHLAFAAEAARVARGEANGRHLAALAPMIKESHRLTLCAEIFVPLARHGHRLAKPANLLNAAPALAVLRGAERHLGRWLVLAEVAASGGDRSGLEEAVTRSTSGPTTARAAWSLVAWALARRMRVAGEKAPVVRPTVEIVSRLSDRPSADRDATFLFRMAGARIPSVRPMLETFVRELPLSSEPAVRAATFLARDHGRADLAAALLAAASQNGRDELRGPALAALHDVGDPTVSDEVRRLSVELAGSRSLANVGWSALVRAALARRQADGAEGDGAEGVSTETAYRWLQWGWLE